MRTLKAGRTEARTEKLDQQDLYSAPNDQKEEVIWLIYRARQLATQ